MVFVSTGLGMYPKSFFPRQFGMDFAPSPVLESMMKHKGHFTVFSNMDHPHIYAGHGGLRSFLNGTGKGIGTSPSISVSGTRVRNSGNPQQLFKKLFVRDTDTVKKALQVEVEEQGSVLDLIRDQAASLGKKVNSADRDKLDEYLTAIRDAENRLQGQQRWKNIQKPAVKMPELESEGKHGDADYVGSISLLFDLYFLAILTNSSRVFTTSFGIHNRKLDLDGVSSGYHSLSHHGRRPDKLKQLAIIETFYIEQVSRFIEKLKNSDDDHGNLLDDTMVLFGSSLSDAARHSNRNLPIMLAGGGFKHKGHINAQQPNKRAMPLNNLYTSMLQKFGLAIEKYNTATGDVNHLLT